MIKAKGLKWEAQAVSAHLILKNRRRLKELRSWRARSGLRPGCRGTGCSSRKKLLKVQGHIGGCTVLGLYCIDSHRVFLQWGRLGFNVNLLNIPQFYLLLKKQSI